jgi:hypothetical protein
MKLTSLLTSLFALLALAFSGCGGGQAPTANDIDFPSWYLDRSQVDGICGFGVTEFNGNVQIATNSSVQLARDELARNFETKIEGFIESGVRAGRITGNDKQNVSSQSAQEQMSRGFVKQNLKFTNTKKISKKGDQFYSMVCLDAAKFSQALREMVQADNMVAKEVLDQSKQLLEEQGSKLDAFMSKYGD